MTIKNKLGKRVLSIVLCLALLTSYLPVSLLRATAADNPSGITTVADPETLTRPEIIYGDNTINAGKITVGKSVSDTSLTVNGQTVALTGENNFLVTISQSAQIMGVTSEVKVPLDVVIVFDTSGSMGNDSNGNGKNRTQELVEAANTMIASLMGMNELNRVGVVAFSAHNAGGGTAGYNAANVLSELAHYDGEAATKHLTWTTGAGPSWAPTVQLVQGRSTTNGKTNSRYGTGGATNIQAGITLGAQLLMEADTTVEINNQTITRIPIMIIMSDGAPTASAYENQWWNASQTNNQGPLNAPFAGNGFLTVLTASHYKNEITRHYYGDNAVENSCSIYTVGVELSDSNTQSTVQEVDLSYMTLNPTGEFVPGSDNYYYDHNTNEDSFLYFWTKYQNNEEFKVRVWSGQTRHDGYYYFYNQSRRLSDANDYKNGQDTWTTVRATTVQPNILSSVTSLHYNDKFYNVTNVSQLTDTLNEVLTEIARKALSVPTQVSTGNHDIDGYVTFTDPIGEYMEVKEVKGILADGYFYRGAPFAQKLATFGTGADPEFEAKLLEVVKARMHLSNSVIDIADFTARALASPNQAYYNGPNDYDNSIVWWGNAYTAADGDEEVQILAFADNDTVEYIQSQQAAGTIPEDADYVCRSYFFYGEAEGAAPNHEYLYFMVRVQRELVAPYRETVVISAPASLLSMEKVLIEETFDSNDNPVYTASVEHEMPARVIYEVGLWDSITAENVSSVVSKDYAQETVNGTGSANYDPATDTYHFFTNDWNRSESVDSHHRGMAKATFNVATDNEFYTYQKDTLLVDANGEPVTSNPAGKTVYYVREYYQWTSDSGADGTYAATKASTLIQVDIPADANLIRSGNNWYIPAGTYTSATLVVNGDDTVKSQNLTGTSAIVAHPHRTGDANDSHYTVLLGNNGKLSLKAETYEPVKTVSVNLEDSAVSIVDDNGKAVQVGDVLTYTIEVKNTLSTAADITVQDYLPMGTAFVAGSAGSGTAQTGHTKDTSIVPDSNNVLTWVLEDVPAGQIRYVSFQATVTTAALSLNVVPGAITNTAQVQINNGVAVQTNPTSNPPYGKSVTDVNNQNIDGQHGFKVGDTLVYHIRFHNNAKDADGNFIVADATVTDKIPEGTTFLSADNNGVYDARTGTVTWSFPDMAANSAKVVSFQVQIHAGAKAQEAEADRADGIEPATGEIYLPNTATISLGNDPQITLTTNTTENWADVGDMVLTKLVAAGGDQSKTFLLQLTESTGMLNGKYPMTGDTAAYVEFIDGKATVSIRHGQTLTLKGLPAGVIITVAEDTSALPGWTPTYNTQSVTITKGAATAVSSVSVTNTYTLQPLTLTLKGIKHMNGTLPAQTTFGFVAIPDSNNPVQGDPLTGEVTVKADGEYAFSMSSKTFTQPGIYSYTISEIAGSVHGVTYDTTKYVLVINVTDNGDGTMSASATLDGNVFNMDTDAISFTNTYVPDDVALTLVARKALKVFDPTTGAYTDQLPAAGQFRFQIVSKGAPSMTTSGSNAADGSITFNTLYFSADMLEGAASKTFTFVATEIVPDQISADPNMLYDLNSYEFQATLSYDGNGQLVITVNGDSDGMVDLTSAVSFTNYANPDSVQIRPVGSKTTSDAPAGVSFSFNVTNTETGNVPAAGVGSANGDITFSVMSFTQPGTYTYWIKESNAGNTTNGITYDTTRYLMKVVVSRNSYNRLEAEVTYWSSPIDGSENVADYTIAAVAPSFHNEYHAGGYINLTATKKLTGRALAAGEFAFKLVRQDNGGVIDGITDANGLITFSTLYYSNNDIPAGEDSTVIHYVMQEVIPTTAKLPGVNYDTNSYDVYVRITDNHNGTISAELVTKNGDTYTPISGSDTGVIFNNVYQAVNGDDVKFRVEKTLNGRDLREGEFDFLLFFGENPAADAEPVDIATNDGNGAVVFEHAISANATPGTYAFTVKEATGSLAGVSYDSHSYTVYIHVADDGKGNIVATIVDASGAPIAPGNDGIVDLTEQIHFVNTYSPGDVTVQLHGTKELTGRELKDREFSFLVHEADVNGKTVATGSNDADGNLLFSSFNISSADMGGAQEKTFTYVVVESNNNIAGVTYDNTVYTVTVTVTDDGNGRLTAVVNYPNNEPIVFRNTYTPASVELPLVAFKTLNGMNLADGAFTFELKTASGGVLQSVTNTGSMIRFKNLVFTPADMVDGNGNKLMTREFTFTVSEKAGEVSGMDYDDTVYTIGVIVTDDGSGHLSASATYSNAANAVELLSFTNHYTPAAVEVELEGTKSIVDEHNKPLTLRPEGFEFEVRDTEGNLVTTATSDADGKITFTGFRFTAAGEYRFLISEKATDKAGFTTDPTVWCVHITIGYNADTGVLYKANEFIHLAPESHDQILPQSSQSLSFVNVYNPTDVTVTLRVKKQLEGRELRANEFFFYMIDNASGLRVAEDYNNASGEIDLSVTYTKAGSYSYTIHELIPDDSQKVGGVTYTEKTYGLTVDVIDEGNGVLKAQVGNTTVTGSGTVDLTGSVIFTNTYDPGSVSITLDAWKRLEGKALEDNMFSFLLVNKADPQEQYTAKNYASGKISFPLTYTEAGTYEYTLSEIKGNANGVTYDEHVYTVVVTVTDDGNGNLHAQYHCSNEEGAIESVPVFNNLYVPAPTDYTPEVTKVYEGDSMRTFDFVLSGEGFDTQTKQNNDQGHVTFDKLVFKAAGSYSFTIYEKADPILGFIRFDTNVYTLQIEVTDNGDGQLEISNISITSDLGRNDLIFRNVHEDIITHKDVYLAEDISMSIDGKNVKPGDILTYTVSYTNYTGKTGNVTITDKIPAHTSYVAGSADNGGSYDNGVLTWNLTNVAADATVTVSFKVTVDDANVTIENGADVIEGSNSYTTNIVTNPVPQDEVVKDVFAESEPTISIDGEAVRKDDTLIYTITYTNSYEAAADVTITDTIPQYTAYVEDSADNGGTYTDGVLTWNVHLEAGESITVSFRVTVVGSNITLTNQASALEGVNKLDTNAVTNPVPEDGVSKDVFQVSAPSISIDGQVVQKGDTLLYKITYANSYEAAADVTITDTIPQYTAYVEGSADHDGVYTDGVLTWNLHLEAGEIKTVSFQVTVVGTNVTLTNQATALEGNNTLETNIVTNPVPEDMVTKDVFAVTEPTVSIDGEVVKKGDILLYKVTYTNSYEAAADVTITDTIPQYTAYVDGSADHDGVYTDGVLTWNVHLAAGESITVSFQVTVTGSNITVVNQATALEGNNTLETNIVTNPVPEDVITKDVFHVDDPTVSIDGNTVHKGDILLYTITYTNSYEAAADVTITDTIPQYTTYISGSADNDGIHEDGVLTWNVHLEAGESITVSFRVKVNDSGVTVENKASALEGTNRLDTNIVTNPVPDVPPQTGDSFDPTICFAFMLISGICLVVTALCGKKELFFQKAK